MKSRMYISGQGGARPSAAARFWHKPVAALGAFALAFTGIAAGSLALPAAAEAAEEGPRATDPVNPEDAPDTATSTREAGEYGTKDHVSGAINADGIANGYIEKSIDLTNAEHTLSGKVVIIMGGTASSGDMVSNSDPGAPDGTVVYMQWKDTDGWVSPVYRAVTHTLDQDEEGNERESTRGTYAFEVPDEVDMNGKVRSWEAQSNTFYRVWCEPQYRTYTPALEHDTGNVLVPLRYGGARSDKWTRVATAGGAFQLIGTNVQKVGIFMTELPLEKIDALGNPAGENYMKATGDKLIEDTQGVDSTPLLGNKNSISGKVYFETGDKAGDTGTLTVNYVGDPVAVGYKVFMTVLTQEGKAAVEKIEAGTNAERLQANKQIKDLIKAHPEYIEATYWTYTNEDGKYTLRATKENTAFDRDYLYMWVEDPTSGQIKPAFSAFVAGPRFVKYNENGTGWEPTPLAGPGVGGVANDVDFGISVADFATLDVLNYSNTNPANVGDTVKIKVDGSMHLDTVIKIMHDGKQVGDDIPVTIDNLVDPYSWVVPEGAEGGVYVAELHSAGNTLAADSFMVVADDADGDGDPDPVDPDTGNDGDADDPTKKVDPDDPNTPEVEGTQHLTHGIALIGKGEDKATVVTSDGDNATHKELIVNEAGDPAEGGADLSGITVTLTAGDVKVTSGTADTWRGTDGLPLVQNFDLHNFGQADYEVTVTENVKNWAVTKASELANGKTIKVEGNVPNLGLVLGYDSDDDGTADVDEKENESWDPAYEATPAEVGKQVSSKAPTFDKTVTDDVVEKEGVPEGATFALGKDAPAGAKVDAKTGVVTITPAADQANKTVSVPVVVTYKDDSTDNATAKFVVGQVKDADGDGVDDTKDKCANTPADAKVDAEGCSVVPVIGDLPQITGTVGTPISEVVVPVTNEGKATITKCEITGAAGLTATYDAAKGGCVITGTPTAADNDGYTLTLTYDRADKDGQDGPMTKNGETAITEAQNPPTPPADKDDTEENQPAYADLTVVAGQTATGAAPEDTVGHDGFPEGTKFAFVKNTVNAHGSWLSIDPATGKITAKPTADGDGTYTARVDVFYPDGTSDTVDAKIIVTEAPENPTNADENTPGYDPASGKPGETVKVPQTGDTTLPEGTKFSTDSDKVTVDPNTGEVTVKVPGTAKEGDKIEADITVTYPDQSTDTAKVSVTVGKPDVADPNPAYAETVVPAGKTTEITPTNDGDEYPEGTKFAIADDFKAPTGYTIEIDEATGKLTVTVAPAGKDGADQEVVEIPVVVTYGDSDAATDNVTATVKLDSDGDKDPDVTDKDDDNDKVPDTDEKKDGTDPKNPDSDGDGVSDKTEKDIKTDPNKPDTDGDGLGDGDEYGKDVDEDGKVTDKVDTDDATGTNPTDSDSDDDGINDGDEVTGDKNPFDNDGDGKGDPTDPKNPDSDGDGLKDGDEIGTKVDPETGKTVDDPDQKGEPITDPNTADTDGDGLDDDEEVNHKDKDGKADPTDPTDPDSDNDGVNDGDEVSGDKNPFKDHKYDPNGQPGNTNPNDADTDNDGYSDGAELNTKVDENGKTVPDPAARDKVTNPNVADKAEVREPLPQQVSKTGSALAGVASLAGLLVLGGVAALVAARKREQD